MGMVSDESCGRNDLCAPTIELFLEACGRQTVAKVRRVAVEMLEGPVARRAVN